MNIGKEIALEAKKKNICKEWFSDMLNIDNIKPLCAMFFIDDNWAMEKDFPSLEVLRRFKGESDQYGLRTDFVGDLLNPEKTALFGNSKSLINYNGFSVSTLIVRHNSECEILASGDAFINVNILDNASVNIKCYENARVFVSNYSEKSKIESFGNVEINKSNFNK